MVKIGRRTLELSPKDRGIMYWRPNVKWRLGGSKDGPRCCVWVEKLDNTTL